LGSLIVTFVENETAKKTQISTNKILAETDLFGGCSARDCNNLEWTLETDEQITKRLYDQYGRIAIIYNHLT
jgi:hypothetical protein